MTLAELKNKIREILPNARFDTGKYGEIIIHTNLEIEDSDRPDRGNRQLSEYWNSNRIQSIMGMIDHYNESI